MPGSAAGPGAGEGASNTLHAGSVGVAAQVGTVHGGLHLHARPDVIVPRQLPAPPSPFVGRDDELASMDRLLDAGAAGTAPALAVIGGAGGVGKTWLALRWAHHRAERFPDGQLFVDLRGFSPEDDPVAPEAALRGFLVALGVRPGAVPDDVSTGIALFRSLTAERRLLVVLDNAAGTDQVVPLLPGGAGCAVVVTSRRVLTAVVGRHGAHHVGLGALSDAEAHDLLSRRAGARSAAEPRAVRELLGFCRGFPLALGVLAARAHVHANVPLAEFAAELRDAGIDALGDGDPAADLHAVLSWSYRALTAEQKRAFSLLGIAPGPDTGLPAAASLTGLPTAAAGRVLRALVEASLLNRDADGRYSMHDLVRGYAAATARRDLTEEARTSALLRVVDCHLHTAVAADRLMYPHREGIRLPPPAPGVHVRHLPDAAAALAWFVTERPNLLAAHRVAVDRGRHDVVWRLAWAHSTFHAWRGHNDERLAMWRAAAAAAEELDDPAVLAPALRHLGRAHARIGQHDEALTHLSRALALTEELGDLTGQAHIHHQLARALGRAGDAARALDHASRTRLLYRDIGRPVWEADALGEMSRHAIGLRDHHSALDHCRTALTTHRRHGNRGGEAAAWEILGDLGRATDDHHAAVGHYRRALALYRDLGSTAEAATALDGLGRAHAALGQHHLARAAWAEVAAHHQEQGRHDEALRTRRRLDSLPASEPPRTRPGAPLLCRWSGPGDQEGVVATTIVNARVFDGTAPREWTSVRFAGGLITECSTGSAAREGDEVVDAAGGTVFPGLIDAHVHLVPGALAQSLTFGVTTVLDMFSKPDLVAAAKEQAGSRPDLADVRSSGIGATAPGGHPSVLYAPFPTLTAPDEAERFVAERVAEGSDYLKIISGVGGLWPALDTVTITALVGAAHARGLLVVAHVSSTAGVEQVVSAGVDVVAHVPADAPLDDDLVARVAGVGIAVGPTLATAENTLGEPGGAAVAGDPRLAEVLGDTWVRRLTSGVPLPPGRRTPPCSQAEDNVRRLAEAGVPLLAGTDAPNPGTAFGASLHRELELLVRCGAGPARALAAATAEPARVFGLTDRGIIAPGRRADLVLVSGDPLADITATRAIERIWRAGTACDRRAFVASPAEAEQLDAFDARVAEVVAAVRERRSRFGAG